MTDRKKPSVTFWAIVVVIVVLVGYPLSVLGRWWESWPASRTSKPPPLHVVMLHCYTLPAAFIFRECKWRSAARAFMPI